MSTNFLHLAVTDSVRQAQEHYYGNPHPVADATGPDELTPEEVDFIQARQLLCGDDQRKRLALHPASWRSRGLPARFRSANTGVRRLSGQSPDAVHRQSSR